MAQGWSFSVQGNLPGLSKSEIRGLPHRGVAVFRDDPDKAIDFCEELRKALEPHAGGNIVFDNIDISQVMWSGLTFQVLIESLKDCGATTARWKSFKCGLDDESIGLLTAWFETLPADGLPREIHLSHNKMTNGAFEAMMTTLEAKRAELSRPVQAIWTRVEQNGVDKETMQRLSNEGKICYVQKLNSPDHRTSTDAVMAMPIQGPRPAATADLKSPALWTGAQNSRQKGKGAAEGWGAKGAAGWWDSSSSSWPGRGPWEQPWASAAAAAAGVHPPGAFARPAGLQSAGQPRSGVAAKGQARTMAHAMTGPAAGMAARSRSPPPSRLAAEEEEQPLPEGWEKHWSDEYNVDYYWNNMTEESQWERPIN